MEAQKRAVGALLQLSRPGAVRGQAGPAEGGHCPGRAGSHQGGRAWHHRSGALSVRTPQCPEVAAPLPHTGRPGRPSSDP